MLNGTLCSSALVAHGIEGGKCTPRQPAAVMLHGTLCGSALVAHVISQRLHTGCLEAPSSPRVAPVRLRHQRLSEAPLAVEGERAESAHAAPLAGVGDSGGGAHARGAALPPSRKHPPQATRPRGIQTLTRQPLYPHEARETPEGRCGARTTRVLLARRAKQQPICRPLRRARRERAKMRASHPSLAAVLRLCPLEHEHQHGPPAPRVTERLCMPPLRVFALGSPQRALASPACPPTEVTHRPHLHRLVRTPCGRRPPTAPTAPESGGAAFPERHGHRVGGGMEPSAPHGVEVPSGHDSRGAGCTVRRRPPQQQLPLPLAPLPKQEPRARCTRQGDALRPRRARHTHDQCSEA